MKLTRDDLTPILSILFAGAVGIGGTAALLDARADTYDEPRRWEYLEGPALRLEPVFETPPAPSYRYTVYGQLIEEIEALRLRQHEVGLRVEELRALSPDARADRIMDVRFEKEQMLRQLAALERRLDGATRAQPTLGGRALERASAVIGRSRLEQKIRYSQSTVERWDAQSALFLEQQIESDLVELREAFLSNWSRR
jgi:hypothetical protein